MQTFVRDLTVHDYAFKDAKPLLVNRDFYCIVFSGVDRSLKNPTGLGGTHDPALMNSDAALVYLLEEH